MSNIMEEVLGCPEGELGFLDSYPEKELEQLKAMFERCRELQHDQTEEAIEAGLQIVPAILRKAVRKAFGGG